MSLISLIAVAYLVFLVIVGVITYFIIKDEL